MDRPRAQPEAESPISTSDDEPDDDGERTTTPTSELPPKCAGGNGCARRGRMEGGDGQGDVELKSHDVYELAPRVEGLHTLKLDWAYRKIKKGVFDKNKARPIARIN